MERRSQEGEKQPSGQTQKSASSNRGSRIRDLDAHQRQLCEQQHDLDHHPWKRIKKSSAENLLQQDKIQSQASSSNQETFLRQHEVQAEILQNVDQDISRYQKELEVHKSTLKEFQKELEASCNKLKQFDEQERDELKALHKQCEQASTEYRQLRSDPQRYQEELKKIDDAVNPLLEKLIFIQKGMINIQKEQREIYAKIQEETIELDKQDSSTHQLLDEGEKRLTTLAEGLSTFIAEQASLRKKMQITSINPIDRVYIKRKKLNDRSKKVCKEFKCFLGQELPKYSLTEAERKGPVTIPRQLQQKRTEITQLYEEAQKTQELVSFDLERSPGAQKLVADIRQLYEDTNNILDEFKKYCERLVTCSKELHKEMETYLKHIKELKELFKDYNPYYSMECVISREDVDIDFTRPMSCGIKTARRGLSKLGIDIHSEVTEEKIAELVKYDRIKGVHLRNISQAYQHYGFDYIYKEELVSIDDIENITKHGHDINVRICKPSTEGHFLLIEGVTRAENDYLVTFYDPNDSKKVALSYKELEKVLTGHYVLPSEEQMQTLEPILKRQQMH